MRYALRRPGDTDAPTRGLSGTVAAVALLVAASGWVASGCGYGSTTTWNDPNAPAEEPGSDPQQDESSESAEPSMEADPVSPGATACRRIDGASAGPAPARLLTNYEYKYTVRDLLDYQGDAPETLPAENKANGFENNAHTHVASKTRIRKFMTGAEAISKKAVEQNLDALLPCDPMAVGEKTCGEEFVRDFLLKAFRRPPTDGEVADFTKLFEESLSEYGFIEAVELTIQAALQSPQFLYRLEYIDPSEAGRSVQVNDWQMATRLSFFLWASMPDRTLREAARNGELSTEEQIRRQVERMLEHPKAKHAVYQFHRQWLGLDSLDSVVKDADRFPVFEQTMPTAWRESVRTFVEYTYFEKGGDVTDLLTSTMVFLPDALANLYEAADGAADAMRNGLPGFRFPKDQRAGILTQPGLMALLANANQSSPIRRGVWVRERLLCQDIPPPPPSSDLMPPDPDPNATTRERFRQHTENPQCASCHKLIDPIGFGFENYDSLGRWRTEENGRSIDATGTLSQTETPAIEGPYDGAVNLADKLKDSEQVRNCIATKWFTYAKGRPVSDTEKCSLYHLQQAFDESDGTFKDLLVSLATSEAFRYRAVPRTGAMSSGTEGGK